MMVKADLVLAGVCPVFAGGCPASSGCGSARQAFASDRSVSVKSRQLDGDTVAARKLIFR
jgi:hypothetical protein